MYRVLMMNGLIIRIIIVIPLFYFVISYPSNLNSFQETEKFRFSVIAEIGIEEAKAKEELPYQFARVRSIDCDREGNIYVLDDKDSCVKVFNKDGGYLRKMFATGQGPKEMSNP